MTRVTSICHAPVPSFTLPDSRYKGERVVWRRPRPRRFRPGGRNDDYSTQQATLHSAGGHRRPSYPRKETFAQPSYPRRRVSSGPKRHSSHQQRLATSMSAPGAVICRRQGAIQLDLPPRRFRLGGRNDDYSTQQATLHSAGGHRRPSYPRKETFAQPSFPRRRESSGPKRHSSHQQRLAASTSAHGAVICRRQGAIQLDLPPRRFRPGGRNDDYSTRQATLCSADGHRRPSYPRRRVSSGPKRHPSHQLWNSHR